MIDSSPYTIINAYGNAFIASEYYAGIYLVRNETELNNFNSTSKVAYS